MFRILAGGFAILGAAFLFLTVVNISDPPIQPEVQKILDMKYEPSENQKKAYYFLLGTYTGDIENAEARGMELYKDLESGNGEEWKKVYAKNWWSEKASDLHIAAYLKLMTYQETCSFKGVGKANLFMPSAVPLGMHKHFINQLSVWLDKKGEVRVMDLIFASNNLMLSLMKHGTMLERILGLVNMRENAEFLAAAKEKRPKLHIPREVIDSFNIPPVNDMIFGAMAEEIRIVAHMFSTIRQVQEVLVVDKNTPEGWFLSWIPVRMAYKPNETINKFANLASQMASTDCPPSMELKICIPEAEWTEFNSPFRYISNPVGRMLNGVMLPQMQRVQAFKNNRDKIMAFRESFHMVEGG